MSFNIKIQNKFSNFKNSKNCDNYKSNECETTSNHNLLIGKNNLKILELCTKKLAKKPNNKRALLLRASIYIKINKYLEAQNDLQSLINDRNLASTAYYLLAIINKKANNNELALTYLTKSIELDDNNINAYFLRGAVNNILGNYKDAIKDYNDAIYKDTLKTEGKNVYKNISKIFAQTLFNQKKYSRKKRRYSLMNDRRKNNMEDKFEFTYNYEINENNIFTTKKIKRHRSKCASEESNLKFKNFKNENLLQLQKENDEKLKNANYPNIVVNSTSNNFNFFIRNIADKKINDKFYDTQNLFKEINGYLNEDDNDERLKNEESIKSRSTDLFHKTITTNDTDGLYQNPVFSLTSNTTSNMPRPFIKIQNESPSSSIFSNTLNINEINNKFSNTLKIESLYNNNLLSDFRLNNNHDDNLSNSQNLNNNEINSINKNNKLSNNNIQNRNIIIENNINNLYTYKINEKDLLSNNQNCDSTKTIINYSKEINNNNELNLSKPFFYSSNEVRENVDEEKITEDEFYCIKGEIERSQGNFYDAIELFTKAIQINPKSFKAFFNRAFTYDKIGFYNQAISDYTSTINLKPNHSFCFYNRGITYNKLGEYLKSINDFSRAIELDPNKPEFYFNRACLFKNTKQYKNAIDDYTILIKLFPKLYILTYNRGICYEKLKIYKNSIKDFESCIQISKDKIDAYYHLATIYKILGQYETSINYLKQLIDIKQDYSPAYHDIGVILTQIGKYETAIQYFNKCIELDNKRPIYYHNRGWAYRNINPQNAINDLTIAINLDNKNPRFYYNRASIYKEEKIYNKAIEDYSIVLLKFDDKNYDSYVNRAFCFAQINNFYDAINDYTKAIEIKNDDFASLCARADLYINVENYFLAIEDLNQIIKLDPNNENAYIKRAKCFEKIKNIKKSYNDYKKAFILSGKKA